MADEAQEKAVIQECIDEAQNALNGLTVCWHLVRPFLQRQFDIEVHRLIAENCDERRGRIKTLREMLDLPATLRNTIDTLEEELKSTPGGEAGILDPD